MVLIIFIFSLDFPFPKVLDNEIQISEADLLSGDTEMDMHIQRLNGKINLLITEGNLAIEEKIQTIVNNIKDV